MKLVDLLDSKELGVGSFSSQGFVMRTVLGSAGRRLAGMLVDLSTTLGQLTDDL